MKHCLIPLTKGQNAIVDSKDFLWLSKMKWWVQWMEHTKSFYAHGWVDGRTVGMQRVIMACGSDEQVDHKNHNTLDNRRRNLRVAKQGQNQHNQRKRSDNTSGYKGVSWHTRDKKWRSYIMSEGKIRSLGYFSSAEEAALAYDKAAKKYFGEFAVLNFGAK